MAFRMKSVSGLPFDVGIGLEVLFGVPIGTLTTAAGSSFAAAVDANEDEEQECQDGTHDDGNQGFLRDVI